MTSSILTRFFPSLACRCTAPKDPEPRVAASSSEPNAAAMRPLISAAGLSPLYELCLDIERGYESGKCMYDSGMTSLAETLTSSTGEIKQVIEECARMCGVLRGLDSYDTFEVTGLECDNELQVLKQAAHDMAARAKEQARHA